MADNHIIATYEEAKFLREILNTYAKTMKGNNHIWQKNKQTFNKILDKVLEAEEFTTLKHNPRMKND